MWNTSKRKKQNEKPYINNQGLSLVELLVAFAVSAIVLSGLTYLIITSLKLYGRTNANVEVQNESQTALNAVMDSALGAKGICFAETDASAISPASEEPVGALFGKLTLNDDTTMEFTGDAVFWQPNLQEMYLLSGTYPLGNYKSKAEAPSEAWEEMKKKLPKEKEARLPYLMAQHVTGFSLKAADYCFIETEEETYFENPLILELSMKFSYEYQEGKFATREIEDNISVRNRLDQVYIQRLGDGSIKEYIRNPN